MCMDMYYNLDSFHYDASSMCITPITTILELAVIK